MTFKYYKWYIQYNKGSYKGSQKSVANYVTANETHRNPDVAIMLSHWNYTNIT